MGLIGKTGIIVAGAMPVAFGAIEAIQPWTDPAWGTATLTQKLYATAAKFTNTLTSGFGLGDALGTGGYLFPAGTGVSGSAYALSWTKTTTAGIGLVVIDGVIGAITRFAAGGRARPKVMGRQLISG